MAGTEYRAFWITEEPDGTFSRLIKIRNTNDLPERGTLIHVQFSSLNYKDALSASGNKGVTRRYPHTPGIDAAGIVENCNSGLFKPGDKVIVTGYDLGMNTFGGFGEYINVFDEWIVPKPENISLEECMIYGTAGFTAGLALFHLLRCGQQPEQGPVLVTGASGGVGSLAVSLLAKEGFEVIASTGKSEMVKYLKNLGANSVIDRTDTDDKSGKALLKPRWAGAIDTVGGNTLSTLLKSCSEHGNVACCGNVSSPLLNTSVYPFILNGINLLGINSATTPMKLRREIWDKLAGEWKSRHLHEMKQITSLENLDHRINEILQGRVTGRVVLKHAGIKN